MWGACLEDIGLYKESLEKCQLIIDIAPNSKEAKRSENSIKMVKEKIQDNEIKK